MKGFDREDTRFSLCGLNCALCGMKLGGYCPGCGGGPGNQSCAIARCSLQRGGVQYCGNCASYPCARYRDAEEDDSFVSTLNRARDMARLKQIGPEAYGAELDARVEMYHRLVESCDDGRRKTLFRQAASLLELADLRAVWAAISAEMQPIEPPKERAARAAAQIEALAEARGISLKMRRKPGNRKT